MPDSTHLLIPFAVCADPACGEAAQRLSLPHLTRLIARLSPAGRDEGPDDGLSPPHERVLARAYGLHGDDGRIPWAAWQAREAGLGTPGQAWAWITPCHWSVGTDHVRMNHPQALRLDAADSQALVAAMRPYFEQDGVTLHYDAPTLWLAQGGLFARLACASLDRVIGRSIDEWMPRTPEAKTLRRLQQEMQMLLYTHPVNEARVRGGQPPVNSFWVSGAGALPAEAAPAPPAGLQITHRLRDAALLRDWAAWAAAWQQIDATECQRLAQALAAGQGVGLTLCGERHAATWSSAGNGLWRRLGHFLVRRPLSEIFRTL